MATMKDVAKEAGVSLGTVSNYVNGSAPVATATAARIQQAIDSLGYHVDLGARALRMRQTRTVGLLIPDISNPYYSEIARAIEHVLWEAGFQTFLCNSADDYVRELSHLSNLANRRVDGILMIHGRGLSHDDFSSQLAVPTVFLDRAVPGYPSVESDNYQGGVLAARHLVDLDHHVVGLLMGDPQVHNVQQRIWGFRDELRRWQRSLADGYSISGPQSLSLGWQVERLMRLEPRPTAVFATNDIVAIGAWRTLLELGYRIPDDVSLVGFDDIELSRLLMPPLTTVGQNMDAMGRAAAELLLKVIRGETASSHIVIPPSLQVRGSTARSRLEAGDEHVRT